MPAFGLVNPALPGFRCSSCCSWSVWISVCFTLFCLTADIQNHHHLSDYFGPFPVPDETYACPFLFPTTLMPQPLLSESVHCLLTFTVFLSSFVFGAMVLGLFIAPSRHFWSYALNDAQIYYTKLLMLSGQRCFYIVNVIAPI
ncbi:hypothetical protein EDD85DRAFT_844760, partial [Armillaria nabsnona]